MKLLRTPQAMNKGLFPFSFDSTLETAVFNQIVQVCLFVKVFNFFFAAFRTELGLLKVVFAWQAALVIVIFTDKAFNHLLLGILKNIQRSPCLAIVYITINSLLCIAYQELSYFLVI